MSRVVGNDIKEQVERDAGIFDMVELEKEAKLASDVEVKLNELIGEALDVGKAKYKLEVFFPRGRLRMQPYPGFISVWSSAGFAHGGGDHNVYLCTAKIDDASGHTKTCASPIDLRFVNKDIAICETCKNVVDPGDLCGQVFAKLTTQYWVRLILKIFRRLESDADINITHIDQGLRSATNIETKEKYQKGELINKSRHNRVHIQYPLTHIIRDTSNGASLETRIKALLSE